MNKYAPLRTAPSQIASDRSFGLVFTCFFSFIALMPLLGGGRLRPWALFIAFAFFLLAFAKPSVLAPANRMWARFGLLLHKIASPIALGIIFLFAVTPIAILMRTFGKDPLGLRLDTEAKSYWIKRSPTGPSADSLKNQF